MQRITTHKQQIDWPSLTFYSMQILPNERKERIVTDDEGVEFKVQF